jgi:UDP-N-acetylmuramate--alanine ligase
MQGYIDDYASSTEINTVHQAVRELYPNQKVLAFFSPICLVEREILLMILPKVYRLLMKLFYWIFILHVNAYGRNKLWLMDKMINTIKIVAKTI